MGQCFRENVYPLSFVVMARLLAFWRFRYRRVFLFLAFFIISLLLVNIVIRVDKSLPLLANELQHKKDYHFLELPSSGEFPENNSSGYKGPFFQYNLHWSVNTDKFPLSKPWFTRNGTVRASARYSSRLALWPEEVQTLSTDPNTDRNTDRIVNQLMYVPPGYSPSQYHPHGKLPLKKILLFFGKAGWGDLPRGRRKFLQDKCPVNTCFLMDNADLIESADAVVFKDRFMWPKKGRPIGQLWVLFLLECPLHTQLFTSMGPHVINWTATYRADSDIPTPYEKYLDYKSIFEDSHIAANNVDLFESKLLLSQPSQINYASGKTKKVAWFVSNCGAHNKRQSYAIELSKHIQVDIYGSCGRKKCPRSKANACFEMLSRDYKFYLSFENANCVDYITEKLFVNSLGLNEDKLNIVPIVMGGRPQDYERAAPPNSYIHIDHFRSPAMLAKYLNELDSDDAAYNAYFTWKASPRKGEFINTYFFCRLCALAHAPPNRRKPSVSYENLAQWWAPKNACIDGYRRWPASQ